MSVSAGYRVSGQGQTYIRATPHECPYVGKQYITFAEAVHQHHGFEKKLRLSVFLADEFSPLFRKLDLL